MKTIVIAEIGINHNGLMTEAYDLVTAAKSSGASIAKFQLFRPEGEREYLSPLAFSRRQIKEMEMHCKASRIKFACTAFCAEDLEWLLENTEMAFVKIPSGEWNNKELLNVARLSKFCVIQSLKKGVKPSGHGWNYLHVVPFYPTPPEKSDIMRVMESWCSGLSDHSGNIFMPLTAVALGAKIIECHITLDKNAEGPDHKASLTPDQFKLMIEGIRAIERGMQ